MKGRTVRRTARFMAQQERRLAGSARITAQIYADHGLVEAAAIARQRAALHDSRADFYAAIPDKRRLAA